MHEGSSERRGQGTLGAPRRKGDEPLTRSWADAARLGNDVVRVPRSRCDQAAFAGVARLALRATWTTLSKSLGSSMAIWLSIFLFSSTPACLRPFMNRL